MKTALFIIFLGISLAACGTGISLRGLETGTTGVPGGAAPTFSFSTFSTMVPSGTAMLSSANFTVLVSSPLFPMGSIAGNSFSSSDPLLEVGDEVMEAFGE